MKKQEQLEYFKKRADLFFNFIEMRNTESVTLNEFKQVSSELYNTGKLSQLKQLNKEVDRWSKELPTREMTFEFWQILKEELGEDYPALYSRQLEKIKKKGILTEEEYEITQDRINEIFQNDDSDEEIKELNQLLAEFELKKTHTNKNAADKPSDIEPER